MLTRSSALLVFISIARASTVPFADWDEEIALRARKLIVAAPDIPAINSAPFTFPRGIGLDGTGAMVIGTPIGSFLCSGALLSRSFFLTAAHCLTDDTGKMIAEQVSVVLFPNPSGTVVLTTDRKSRFHVHPLYDGEVISDFDIALIHLPEPAPDGVNTYELLGTPVTTSPHTVVGFGSRGDGTTGDTLPSGARRRGFNQFDFFNSPGVLITDFDNGLAANDATCVLLGGGFCVPAGLGLGGFEALTAGGDSGGPVFLNGAIVGIASFGATFGNPPDIDDNLNSTFGEFAGFTYVGIHREWVRDVMAPEPSSWIAAAGGLLLLAGMARRRRS